MRRVLIVLAGLALAACATSSDLGGAARQAGAPASSKPRAERPTYTLGEKWIRYDGAYELVRIEGDRYIFASGPNSEIHLTKSLGLAKVTRGGYMFEFKPPAELTWPLQVGRLGSFEGSWVHSWQCRAGCPTRFTWSVDAYEDVDVVAGTFKAFRISLVMGPGGPYASWQQRWSRELTMWYAPEVRQFVKASGADLGMLNFQVVSVERPDLAPLQVALHGVKDQDRVATEELQVAGKVTTGRLVQRVAATLNGEEVQAIDERGSDKKEVLFDFPVKLREGKNVLIVTAVDSRGDTVQEARTFFYDKPAPPVAPAPAAPAPPPVVAKP
ncbi:MAG: hypothetical protein WAP47_01955, partial [Candidatus Rokuibacteriota bacterium]